jgi:uncharacterized protein
MAKPAGPSCNLRCEYCFYLEKESLLGHGAHRMSDEVLEAYIRQCAGANLDNPSGITFAWQGGEPTLMGLDFFKKAVALEKRYSQGRPFVNTLQTNGTLLNDEWCQFLAANGFLVGLSLDGPEHIHDRYRRDAGGAGTFKKVLGALKLLQKYGVEYNVLACVARETAGHPLEVYRFLREQGVKYIQFSPIVERKPNEAACVLGLALGTPPSLGQFESMDVMDWTVKPAALGEFYRVIFDEWVRNDVGKVFVMNFEWVINGWLGGEGAVCHMSRQCGNCLVVEHDGEVYSCDQFVYPEFRLGNLMTESASSMASSARQAEWGMRKEASLPKQCLECEVGVVCRGGCPKHRFGESYHGEPGLNYLCTAHRSFYMHVRKYAMAMGKLLEMGLPCEYVMQAIKGPVALPIQGSDGQPVILWVK